MATALDDEVLLYALPSGEPIGTIGPLPDTARDLAFSHDGKWLALAGDQAHLLLLDVDKRVLGRQLVGHEGWVNTVRFSPDDSMLLSASDDGTVRLWSLATRSTVLMFHTFSPVTGIAFSLDGRSILYTDQSTIHLVPIDPSYREADPQVLLDRAEDESHLELRGSQLVPRSAARP